MNQPKIVLDGQLNTLRSLAEMHGWEIERVIPKQGAELKHENREEF